MVRQGSDKENVPAISHELASRLRQLILSTNLGTNLDTEQKWMDMATILIFTQTEPQRREDILRNIGLTNHSKNYTAYIEPLEGAKLLAKLIPDKPQSPKQKYYLTEKGKALLSSVS